MYNNNISMYEKLDGFWIAPETFLEESGSDNVVFYINTKDDSMNMYVLIQEGENMLVNECIDVDMKKKISISECIFDVSVKSDMENDLLPSEFNIKYEKEGKILVYKDDTIYALLYKDNQYSDID